ncbi:POC1 centriolar protein A [Ceratobasidium sp. 395]|nr:POC1 centriolar protein A [Ceratobasidium sp. 395]
MAARKLLSTTGDVAFQLLKLTAAASDAFPPLKSAAAGALHIAEIVKVWMAWRSRFRAYRNEWRELGDYVRDATASVVQTLAHINESDRDIVASNLENLKATLDETAREIESEQALPKRKRFLKFMQDSDMIADIKKRVNNSIAVFQLSATTTTMVDVGRILDAVIANGITLSQIAQDTSAVVVGVSLLGLNATLDKLPRVQGASWDPSRGCMVNTRVNLIDEIMEWVDKPVMLNRDGRRGGAKILLLTAVAGAGKTTVAHTVARRCHERNQLGSSFFFDRETDGRNSPAALFTTIAADLCGRIPGLSERLTEAIEADRSLPLAPISRQFQELLLKPCLECRISEPIVIVIDALDEAPSEDLVDILRDQASQLPGCFHIFLTSRMRSEFGSLLGASHVVDKELNIGAQSNINDMKVYAPAKLRQFARKRVLQADWPGEQLQAEFVTRAGGLFLWVATVCEYLDSYENPTEQLRQLLSTTDGWNNSAEDRMRELYTRILAGFNWKDPQFVASYHRVMGTAIATRTPLTISAMRDLYHDTPLASDFALHRLSPLLTGMRKEDHESQPVRVLHQSLRDFLAAQDTRASYDATEFRIVEREHNQELALLCLESINRSLDATLPGTGYLIEDENTQGKVTTQGIPALQGDEIPEALRYACLFWQVHVKDITTIKNIKEVLGRFLEQKLVLWMELVTVCGQYRGLSGVQKWVQLLRDDRTIVMPSYEPVYARTSLTLNKHLEYEDRREEALEASSEALQTYRMLAAKGSETYTEEICRSLEYMAVDLANLGRREDALVANEESLQLNRQLATDQPAAFTPALASSLSNLSSRLSDMGRREEVLAAIEEAVELYRQLAADRPAAFTPDLAMSLNNLSSGLSDMGRREEALAAIEEAVQLRRQLAADRPAAFTPALALCLNNLSSRLSDMGRREEALAAIEEAVQLRRQLAADRPAAFTPDLAISLNNRSVHLFDMGRREEALAATKETVQLFRQLAADRPAAFTPDLAMSLNNLSGLLSGVGRREEALAAIEEAVQLRRQLAADRPAAFTSDLADSLHNLSIDLSGFERHDEALSAIQEAIILWRPLAASLPLRFSPDLKKSLDVLSDVLTDMGRHEEAAGAQAEMESLPD